MSTGLPRLGSYSRERMRMVRAVSHTSRSEEHTSELQSRRDLVCRLLLEKKKTQAFQAHASRAQPHPVSRAGLSAESVAQLPGAAGLEPGHGVGDLHGASARASLLVRRPT